MKGILEFDLPEESGEHQTAIDGAKWKGVVWELDQWLRGHLKHGEPEKVTLQEVRDKLYELLNEDNLML